jgi:hypothetical protein
LSSLFILTVHSRYSRHGFHVVGDPKIIEYSRFLVMTVTMLLRHVAAILAKKATNYGPFKLRGTEPQFHAALTLYQLFQTTGSEDLGTQADWMVHNLFEMLLCAEGFDDRAINYPTDQVIFIWAFLSDHRYRISSHVQSLLSTAKYCLRCIVVQIGRIQVQGNRNGTFFEETVPMPSHSGTDTEDDHSSGDSSAEDDTSDERADRNDIDAGTLLEWLDARLDDFRGGNEGIFLSEHVIRVVHLQYSFSCNRI